MVSQPGKNAALAERAVWYPLQEAGVEVARGWGAPVLRGGWDRHVCVIAWDGGT